jgi:Domain of unknown function (DUF5010)
MTDHDHQLRLLLTSVWLFVACAIGCGPMGTAVVGDDSGAGCVSCQQGGSGDATGQPMTTGSGGAGGTMTQAPVMSSEFTPRPEYAGPCTQAAGPVDVNLGNAPEAFVRAAYCQVNGSEPPTTIVDMWATQLRTVPYVRRIDVVRSFCKTAGRTCALSYSDPWATDVALTAPCTRKTTRDLGAVFMFFSDCPGRVNCGMDWANTHSLGMATPDNRFAFGSTLANYYNPKNAGFWYRELIDARWAGLQFLLLNVYGPDLTSNPDPLAMLGQALAQAGPDVKIALFDDPWAWGKASSPASWQPAPNLSDTEGSAQKLYQAKWKPFYTRLARDDWYLVQGRPFIYFYNAGTLAPANVSAAVVNRMKQLFLQDFGVLPFVAVDGAYFQDPSMEGTADGRFTWDTIRTNKKSRATVGSTTLDHFMVKWDSLGRDKAGAIAASTDRMLKGTTLLDQMLTSSQDAQIAVIATWNDLGEGTGIERNYDYYAGGAWLAPTAFMGLTRAAQCSD